MSQYDAIKDLSNEQLGRLFRALFENQRQNNLKTTENNVVLDNDIKIAFNFINNQMVVDNEKYLKKCETLRNNAKKGGAPKGNQNARKQKQPNRKKNNLNDNENEHVNVNGNEYDNGLLLNTTTIYSTKYKNEDVTVILLESSLGLEENIKMLLAHEYTHWIREKEIKGDIFESCVGERLITEGIACSFSEEIVPENQ